MSAALSGGVMLYATFPGAAAGGWEPVTGGTSEATPEFAGIVAITDQYARTQAAQGPPRADQPGAVQAGAHTRSRDPRRHAGNNTAAFRHGGKITTVKGYTARRGYDLATGVGTIDAARFVPELARAA